jgi:hypothetical protein
MRRIKERVVPFWKHYGVSIAVCLLTTIREPLSVLGSQSDSGAAEAIRQKVEGFRERDLLKVRLHDNSERLGCLKAIESDGLLIGLPDGGGQKLLYGDIATVTREQPQRATLLRRVVLPVAALTGVIFGAAKIGSNTPKTVALKIYLGSGVGVMIGQALNPRVPTCR